MFLSIFQNIYYCIKKYIYPYTNKRLVYKNTPSYNGLNDFYDDIEFNYIPQKKKFHPGPGFIYFHNASYEDKNK